ncbi:NADPH-dependent 2,4-dienoyl-CoA reductase/sulfur reductase-like enzyme/rhodanese-related sulfurtransferase [Desulfitispora alkaliphila]|uniref:FAD-dependent oxidoreductase n=1 Tax=Desulfitispora alkaliphila TaxID=622674 RepID=UPI003D1B954C
MKAKKIVIIGGVATGPKVAARLRRLDPEADITVIEKGEHISYGGCGLPLLVGGVVGELNDLKSTASGAIRNNEYFLKEKGVDFLTGTEVEKINKTDKEVVVYNKRENKRVSLSYDKLVIATGAEAVIPPVPGSKLPGVVTLHKPQDAITVKENLSKDIENIVIVGGGLIGLETAEALADPRKTVTVIEREDRLASNMLDMEMAQLVKDRLELNMVDVLVGESITEIIEQEVDGKTTKVVKTEKNSLQADLVIMACGVRPNTKLAQDSGIEVGVTGGIKVNEYLQTSVPDIYAGGDCVENIDIVSKKPVHLPLASIANKQGRVIANNIAGIEETFPGVLGTSAFPIFELNVGKTGLTEAQAMAAGFDPVVSLSSGLDATHYHPEHAPGTIKLIAEKSTGKILGAQAVGVGDVIKRIDIISTAIYYGGTVDDLRRVDLCYAPVYATAIDLVNHAANTLENVMKGYAKTIKPTEVTEKLKNPDNLLFLDVRSPNEAKANPYQTEHSINIPLNEIRDRLTEIPQGKEVITVCPMGIRAYEAFRVLKHNGYENTCFIAGGLKAIPEEEY